MAGGSRRLQCVIRAPPIVLYAFGNQAAGIYAAALFIILQPVKTISNDREALSRPADLPTTP